MQYTCIKLVPADHPSIKGHFPGNPVVPGALLLGLVEQCIEEHWKSSVVSNWDNIKFLHPLVPGGEIAIRLTSSDDKFTFVCLAGDVEISRGRFSLQGKA